MAYKNSFYEPTRVDHPILGRDKKLIGTLRVKPSGLLWKAKGRGKFYRVELKSFTDWITAPSTGATRTKV